LPPPVSASAGPVGDGEAEVVETADTEELGAALLGAAEALADGPVEVFVADTEGEAEGAGVVGGATGGGVVGAEQVASLAAHR